MFIFLIFIIDLLFIWNLYLLQCIGKLEKKESYLVKDNNKLRKELKQCLKYLKRY